MNIFGFFLMNIIAFSSKIYVSDIFLFEGGRGYCAWQGSLFDFFFLCGYSVLLTPFIKYSFIFNLGIVCVFLIILSLPLGGDSIARKLQVWR